MPRRGSILALAALTSSVILAHMGWAQKRAAPAKPPVATRADDPGRAAGNTETPIDEFETMSPEHQRQALEQLPAAQRRKLQERLDKFNQLPAEQQRALKNLYNRLHQLPADRQNTVRKAIQKFSLQPADRQQTIREELRDLAAVPVPERSLRLTSPEFLKKFSGQEREIVRVMSLLLPPR